MRTCGQLLEAPLDEVTFVVVDLETTGLSPTACEITEVGAVKVRAGEILGEFHTFVTLPQVAAREAVGVEVLLPSFLEFARGAVIVGHNVRFDLSFLETHLRKLAYEGFGVSVDTLALARRTLQGDVPDHRLGTLAAHFGTSTVPNHRALDDARATNEVLHHLLELLGPLGVTGLDDLLAFPRVGHHPQRSKLRWVARLPREPGVYRFLDRAGTPIFVGATPNLRNGVRELFEASPRGRSGSTLREASSLAFELSQDEAEAASVADRLIHELRPARNPEWRTSRIQRPSGMHATAAPKG